MRPDMAKVIVERPRVGGHGARKGRAVADDALLPKFKGVRRQVAERGDRKQLNENLAPLRRFLERQVNRPWNKVHSEISARINGRSTVQAHVLTHLKNLIYLDVEHVAPGPDAPCGLRSRQSQWFFGFQRLKPGALYVDPKDGIIKRARRRKF